MEKGRRGPAVSIIVPVFNVEAYLERCLESLSAQTFRDVEIILVDDGSRDSSGRLCDEYGKKAEAEGRDLRVIHQERGGAAAARNSGLRVSRGEWIFFADPDDYLDPDGCERMMGRAGKSGADIVLFDAFRECGRKTGRWEHFEEEFISEDRELIRGLQRGVLYAPCSPFRTEVPLAAPWDKLYRRAFLVENGLFFPEGARVLDDLIFNVEAFGRAKRICYAKEKGYHYCVAGGSITRGYTPGRARLDEEAFRRMEEYFRAEKGDDRLLAAYRLRVAKSFCIGLKLDCFHRLSGKPFREKYRTVLRRMGKEPYRTALETADTALAEERLRLAICLLRGRHALIFCCLMEAYVRLNTLRTG